MLILNTYTCIYSIRMKMVSQTTDLNKADDIAQYLPKRYWRWQIEVASHNILGAVYNIPLTICWRFYKLLLLPFEKRLCVKGSDILKKYWLSHTFWSWRFSAELSCRNLHRIYWLPLRPDKQTVICVCIRVLCICWDHRRIILVSIVTVMMPRDPLFFQTNHNSVQWKLLYSLEVLW